VFDSEASAEAWFRENDPEGVAPSSMKFRPIAKSLCAVLRSPNFLLAVHGLRLSISCSTDQVARQSIEQLPLGCVSRKVANQPAFRCVLAELFQMVEIVLNDPCLPRRIYRQEPSYQHNIWVMCGRRPRCKENLTFGLRSGASHVSGLFARHHDRWP
jgi:hypothetical protein